MALVAGTSRCRRAGGCRESVLVGFQRRALREVAGRGQEDLAWETRAQGGTETRGCYLVVQKGDDVERLQPLGGPVQNGRGLGGDKGSVVCCSRGKQGSAAPP